MKAGRIIALLMGLTLMALLLPMQATAAGAAPGIVMGGGAVTKGSTIVMAGTKWDVVLNTTSMDGSDGSDGRLLMTSVVKSAGTADYWTQMNYINTFYASSFADLEKAAVMSTSKTDPAGNYAGIRFADSSLSGAKLFALSASEATSYFGSDDERLPAGWWLRSLGRDDDTVAGVVHGVGSVESDTTRYNGFGVRPAFNLNLSSVLFSSAAEGGKSSAVAVGAALFEIPSNTSGKWKLTLLDSDRVFTASVAETDSLTRKYGYDDWTLHISYDGALTGSREYVSALLCDSFGRARYYGHLASSSASGTVMLAMPDGLGVGEYTLRLFSEQCNGDNATDYGSAFADITLTVPGETHTVTFDMAGAGHTPAAQTVGHGDYALEPNVTLYDGYTLTGWEYQPSGATEYVPFDFSAPIMEDTTIYASWSYEQRHYLTVNASGLDCGSFTVTGSDDVVYARNQSVNKYIPNGIQLTLNIVPNRNCTFSGSISPEGHTQPIELTSDTTSYSLGDRGATVDLAFEKLPVLTMNVTPDELETGYWKVKDGRGRSYEDKSAIPIPSGEFISTDDMLTLTITPGNYGFDGSIDNNGAVTQIADGVTSYTFTATGPVTISLNYYSRSAYYTIYFHNGDNVTATQRVAVSPIAGKPVIATLDRASYNSSDIFNGWNKFATPTELLSIAYADGAEILLSGDIHLYAQWIDAWAVTFNANGGEGGMDKYRLPKSNAAGTLPACAFTRGGYAFAGWNNKANGTGTTSYVDGAEVTLTKSLTLFAQWTPAWTVTFDANGGEGLMSALPVAKGQSAALPAGAFTRDGYDFAGWATAANGAAAYADGAAVTPAADMTLYAVWTPVRYTISYELDGGALPQGVTNPEEYTIESDPIRLNAPEKAGSVFGGWYADAQFERQVSGIGQGSTGNKTFWARWKTIEVSFGPAAFTLPASLTTIEASAFAGDTALTVMDAHSVTAIGAEAFRGCMSLTQIHLHRDCQIDPTAFAGCGTVYVFAPVGGDTQASCASIANCVFMAEPQD